ncbi:MAG: hypothetical protein ACI9U2_001947 [Bradymonadia bacterium]|jgi:hypothetical protein
MANRLSREPLPGGTGVLVGWIALITSIGAGVIAVFEGPAFLPFALGLLLVGALWIMHGKHLSRRPGRCVQVDADGLLLMPERWRFEVGGLGELVILERKVLSAQTNVAFAATVHSLVADIELIELIELDKAGARAAADAWVARLEDAQAGRLAPDQITALDARIEAPDPAFLASATALSVVAFGLVVMAYGLAAPALMLGVGVGVVGVAAVSSWRLIERRTLARVLGWGLASPWCCARSCCR